MRPRTSCYIFSPFGNCSVKWVLKIAFFCFPCILIMTSHERLFSSLTLNRKPLDEFSSHEHCGTKIKFFMSEEGIL
uniref:Uncharacterized protein n=1 Tax=Rhizophora mucronata TaxID=61149 RepID=A0A2P2JF97_RHIMU